VDHVVGQILVQIRQTVRVAAQALVLSAQAISSRYLAELHQVDHIECADMVASAAEVVGPIAALPEAES